MKRVSTVIVNEHGNQVSMVVTRDEEGVHVFAASPGSVVEHTWTVAEAEMLMELLRDVSD